MDIGLVCDVCDAFNPMAAASCASCGAALSLGGRPKRPTPAAHAHPGNHAAAPHHNLDGPTMNRGGVGLAGTPAQAPRTPAASTPVPQPRVCAECNATIQPGYRFCGSCGAKVPDAAPAKKDGKPRTMFFGAMQLARAKLVLIKGDGLDGISFTLAGQEHIAGRTEGPLLFQEDPYLSPRHANFYYKDNKLYVRDETSQNGIYLRIRAPGPLRSGDTFLVGEQVLRVETTPPETAGLGPDDEGTYVFASPRRASKMRLVQLLRGGDVGLIFRAVGDQVTLGREGNDINFPDDPFISGRHAQVSFTDAGLVLTDLGSKNGTFLRISQDTPLSHGDYVFMGQQLLRVEVV
jgi:pSer/pThr/pTyr-binding forkhead associated (FHA) protein/ribosomal protein L40E